VEGGGAEASRVASEAHRLLTQDLKIAGFFEILDPANALADPFQRGISARDIDWEVLRLLGADIVVGGVVRQEPSLLRWEARVFDQPQHRMVFGKNYKGQPRDLRVMVHRFVDEIVRYYTGSPGVFQSQIAFLSKRSETKELYVMDVDGENLRQITETQSRVMSARPNMNGPAAWSPDGKHLAITLTIHGNPELYLIDREGAILKRLTQHPSIDVSPSWSPDGRALAFVSNRSGGPQIYILDLETGNVRRLTYEGNYNTDPAWSPRGDRIAYSAMFENSYEICSIHPDGSQLFQLTDNPGDDESPSWSPDGRYLAFSSTRPGSAQIFVMLYNGENPVQITRLLGDQTSPAWSPWPRGR
jgi:TolB protein